MLNIAIYENSGRGCIPHLAYMLPTILRSLTYISFCFTKYQC